MSARLNLNVDDTNRTLRKVDILSILKTLLPEGQTDKIIYNSFEEMINNLDSDNWIILYIFWEILLFKQLGFEINFFNKNNQRDNSIQINNKSFVIPKIHLNKDITNFSNNEINEALIFNRNLLMENFIIPNKLKIPLFRNMLEKYYI